MLGYKYFELRKQSSWSWNDTAVHHRLTCALRICVETEVVPGQATNKCEYSKENTLFTDRCYLQVKEEIFALTFENIPAEQIALESVVGSPLCTLNSFDVETARKKLVVGLSGVFLVLFALGFVSTVMCACPRERETYTNVCVRVCVCPCACL